MFIQEVRERIAQGWTFAEASMGKGWQTKYPNIASWQGGYSMSRSKGRWNISLQAHSRSELPGFYTITCTLVEEEGVYAPEQDIYEIVDGVIKAWNDEHGVEAILQFNKRWMGEAGWRAYPYISAWVRQSRRHCIRIRSSLVTHKSYAKAWLYDKPSNIETVIFENEVQNFSEDEVLRMLDEGVGNWMRKYNSPEAHQAET